MRPFSIITSCFILLIIGTAAIIPSKTSKKYISNFENVLGTSLQIRINSTSEKSAENAEAVILAEVDRLDLILSAYNKKSEFSKWSSKVGEHVKVSPELFEVLDLFDQWTIRSGGALSAAAETIGQVWKEAARTGELPKVAELDKAVSTAASKHWSLDAKTLMAKRLDNSPLALNSFVKSYIINKAANAALKCNGVSGVLVNIGGDMVIKGDLKEPVNISDPKADAENDVPLATLMIGDRAIATSGNYRRGYNINNKWYSHILDPRSGKPVEDIISATVIAEDATTAGALATAFNVLSVEESIELANKNNGTEYLIIKRNGDKVKSAGWDNLNRKEAPEEMIMVPSKLTEKSWNSKYELILNLELALIEGQRIHRPFVAIWIEDANKKPVRNLAIWFNKARWLPDLKNWYRTYGLDFNAEGNPVKTTSSATRSPGKYTIKWDGKDDKGTFVKSGSYTVHIEVVREHGTYQLISQELNFNGIAKKINLQKNVEVASASLDYRKTIK